MVRGSGALFLPVAAMSSGDGGKLAPMAGGKRASGQDAKME